MAHMPHAHLMSCPGPRSHVDTVLLGLRDVGHTNERLLLLEAAPLTIQAELAHLLSQHLKVAIESPGPLVDEPMVSDEPKACVVESHRQDQHTRPVGRIGV